MAESTASVRLTLKDRGFVRTFARSSSQVERRAQRAGSQLRTSLTNGVRGGVDALKNMGNQIKSLGGMVGGIVGGLGMAELIRGAIDAETQFRNLAFSIERGTGEAVAWEKVMQRAKDVSEATGADMNELGVAMEEMLARSGNADFMAKGIETVATTAKASGEDLGQLATIAGELNQKMGISAKELPQAMAAILAGTGDGGATVENLADDFAEVAGKAKSFGIEGPEGIRKMLGVLNLAKKEGGNFQQAMTAIPQIFDQIIERSGKGGDLEKKLHIQTVGPDGQVKDPFQILTDIISETKGNRDLLGELGFSGEGIQTILALAKPFQRELERTGGDIDAAEKAVARALERSAGSKLSQARIETQAAANRKSAAGQIDDAMNELKEAFSSPEMIGSLTELAKVLPPVADGLAKLLDFAQENPGTSAALAAGGVAAKGAVQGALAGGAGAAAAGAGSGAAAGGAGTGAGAAAGGLLSRLKISGGLVNIAAGASMGSGETSAETKGFMQLGFGRDTAETLGGIQGGISSAVGGPLATGARALMSEVAGIDEPEPETETPSSRPKKLQNKFAGLSLLPEQEEFSAVPKGSFQSGGFQHQMAPAAPEKPQKVQLDQSQQAQQASQMAREFGATITQKELRVRVLNVEELRSNPAPAPGANPRPGSAT